MLGALRRELDECKEKLRRATDDANAAEPRAIALEAAEILIGRTLVRAVRAAEATEAAARIRAAEIVSQAGRQVTNSTIEDDDRGPDSAEQPSPWAAPPSGGHPGVRLVAADFRPGPGPVGHGVERTPMPEPEPDSTVHGGVLTSIRERWDVAVRPGKVEGEFLSRPGHLRSLTDGSYIDDLRGTPPRAHSSDEEQWQQWVASAPAVHRGPAHRRPGGRLGFFSRLIASA